MPADGGKEDCSAWQKREECSATRRDAAIGGWEEGHEGLRFGGEAGKRTLSPQPVKK